MNQYAILTLFPYKSCIIFAFQKSFVLLMRHISQRPLRTLIAKLTGSE